METRSPGLQAGAAGTHSTMPGCGCGFETVGVEVVAEVVGGVHIGRAAGPVQQARTWTCRVKVND